MSSPGGATYFSSTVFFFLRRLSLRLGLVVAELVELASLSISMATGAAFTAASATASTAAWGASLESSASADSHGLSLFNLHELGLNRDQKNIINEYEY